jgi:hypothetical protein
VVAQHQGQEPAGPAGHGLAALGAGSNDIVVSPEHDLVIVWRWHAGNPAEFAKRVIAALPQK